MALHCIRLRFETSPVVDPSTSVGMCVTCCRCSPCTPGTFMAEVAQQACETCAPGLFNNIPGRSFCDKCDAGSTYNTSTSCQLCLPGTFSASPGTTRCNTCPVGSVAMSTGMSSCTLCQAGRYAPSRATTCLPCAAGTFSVVPAAPSCDACVAGKFAARTGQTECSTCSASVSMSASGASVCTCVESYFSVGIDSNGTNLCALCSVGASCATLDATRTATTLRSVAGYYRVPNHIPVVILKCPLNPVACLSSANGSCADGYRGPLCGVCAPGYHLSSRACEVCAGTSNMYLLPVLIVALVVFAAIFVYISRRIDLSKLVGAAKVFVSYLQVMGSSSSTYQIPWPDFMQGLLLNFRLALMDVMQVLAIDCWRQLSFYDGYLFTTISTSVLLLLVPMLHRLAPYVVSRYCPQRMGAPLKEFRNLLVKGIAIFVRMSGKQGKACDACVVAWGFFFFFSFFSFFSSDIRNC